MVKWLLAVLGLGFLVVIYAYYDPETNPIFPKCPLRELTGYKCPGCGSQRAIHDLMHLDFSSAFQHNMLLVISIPYIVVGAVFDLIKYPSPRLALWRQRLFGTKAILTVLFLIIAFWIGRNIWGG